MHANETEAVEIFIIFNSVTLQLAQQYTENNKYISKVNATISDMGETKSVDCNYIISDKNFSSNSLSIKGKTTLKALAMYLIANSVFV